MGGGPNPQMPTQPKQREGLEKITLNCRGGGEFIFEC